MMNWRCIVCGYVHGGDWAPDRCPMCGIDASNFEEVVQDEESAANAIVIVGGGVAGVMAAEAARAGAPEARVVLIHDEPGLPYNRLNLTRMIAGEIPEDGLELKNPAWYDEKNIEHVHDSVTAVLRDSKEISLRDGGPLGYGSLVLATGANPFVPPIPGVSLPGVSTLRTLSHAKDILANVAAGTRCVCIGGGLLGIELAAGLSKRGARVTILEGSGWLLARQLVEPASRILKAKIESMGIGVRCGARVAAINGAGKVTGVSLEGGEALAADMVLISAGVRPNTALASECGLEVGRGLKVDDAMRTGDPAIFGAGDVTEHRGITYGLWPVAMAQGKVAGANAAGGGMSFEGVSPSAFLKVVGVDVFSIGRFISDDPDAKVIEKEENGNYARLVLKGGLIIGANLVGDIGAALPIKSAVEKGLAPGSNPRLLTFFPKLAGMN